MPPHESKRTAFNTALQFDRLVVRILDGIKRTHPLESSDLAEYTNEMMCCLRRSNNCVHTEQGRQESFQAAVWMVEALIILNDLHDNGVEYALVTAAIEVLERVESDLRIEGSLPSRSIHREPPLGT
jgi:hypothetical protein